MTEKKSFFRRAIEFPQKLELAIEAGLVWVSVQVSLWLASFFPGVDFAGALKPLAVAFALFLAWLIKTTLEKVVPEKFHYIINAILAWLAMYVGASYLFQFLAG